jgi:hypothetical protein
MTLTILRDNRTREVGAGEVPNALSLQDLQQLMASQAPSRGTHIINQISCSLVNNNCDVDLLRDSQRASGEPCPG